MSIVKRLLPFLVVVAIFTAALLVGRYLYWEVHLPLVASVLLVGLPSGLLSVGLFIRLSFKYYD